VADRRSSSIVTAVLLVLILAGAWGLRHVYLSYAETTAGFIWDDPDGYTRQARTLVDRDGHWRWSWEGVHYTWNNRTWVLPPGYPFVLSFFARDGAAFPRNAGYFHPVLGTILCGMLFWLGARLHGARAGLIAALIGALWMPQLVNGNFFFQEQLYLPLLVFAFALTVEMLVRESTGPGFVLPGVAFGVATLTRAMPLYFVPVAVAVFVLGSSKRSVGWRRSGWFCAAFAISILPYIAALSAAHGQLILIDNHGSIQMDRNASSRTTETPGVADTARMLATEVVTEPTRFAAAKYDMMRGLFQVQGGRWLQHYRILPDARSAAIWKWTAHAGFDALFVGVALLAPIGLVVARRPLEAVLVALWIPEVVALSAIAGYAGARYRSPFEPHLIVLASACLAGGWRPAGKLWLALGVAGSILVGAVVLPQVPRSLAARAQYGVAAWNGMVPGATTTARGPAGVNLLPREGTISFRVALSEDGNRDVTAAVWLNGRRVSNLVLGIEPHDLTLTGTGPGFNHVEIEPLVPTGQPAPVYTITVSR
jgi:hypothetical protein